MARASTLNVVAATLLLVLVTFATVVDVAAGNQITATAAATGGRRGGGREQSAGLTQCVAGCGDTVTSCMLDCYTVPSADRLGERNILPICLLDCTNVGMFCAAECSTQNLN